MAFDPSRSRWVGWLNLVAAAVTIAGVIGKLSGQAILGPLQLAVPIPLWALLVAFVFGPTLTLVLTRRWSAPAPQVEPGAEPETVGDGVEAQLMGIRSELSTVTSQLKEYESLEREILGLLSPGSRLTLQEILDRVSVRHDPDGAKKVRLAAASLRQAGKVVGTGGTYPQLQLQNRH